MNRLVDPAPVHTGASAASVSATWGCRWSSQSRVTGCTPSASASTGNGAAIGRGRSYDPDMPAEDVQATVQSGALAATTDFADPVRADAVSICAPTPLRKTRDPDLSHVAAALEGVATHQRAGQLVVLESTTCVGTIDEVVRPRLEVAGLCAGADFFLAFSPERVAPASAA